MGRELLVEPKQGTFHSFSFEYISPNYEDKINEIKIIHENYAHVLYPVKQVYTNLEGNRANLVQTSWALLSLIDAGQVSNKALCFEFLPYHKFKPPNSLGPMEKPCKVQWSSSQ